MARTHRNRPVAANTDHPVTTGATTAHDAGTLISKMANPPRGSMNADVRKHIVLGPIFLKYVADPSEPGYAPSEFKRRQPTDPQNPTKYVALANSTSWDSTQGATAALPSAVRPKEN